MLTILEIGLYFTFPSAFFTLYYCVIRKQELFKSQCPSLFGEHEHRRMSTAELIGQMTQTDSNDLCDKQHGIRSLHRQRVQHWIDETGGGGVQWYSSKCLVGPYTTIAKRRFC
jgi:hypothetical protein